jgi:hypothetical protein
MNLDHQEVRSAPGPKHPQGTFDIVRMSDLGPALHRDLGSRRQLTAERSDN